MTRSKDFYLLLLEYALLDMRGESTDLAHKLADIFHNVPGALRLAWTEDRDERIYTQLREKAKAYGLAAKLDRWEEHALAKTQFRCQPTEPELASK